ncbi:hypothetical protein V8G54_004411 [Vigna mungo]|uniref:Uncharacterized protein n=1 Tax=Vigna mungo TaxID=3915 RepID=A0AAQ3PGA3_VIGMU
MTRYVRVILKPKYTLKYTYNTTFVLTMQIIVDMTFYFISTLKDLYISSLHGFHSKCIKFLPFIIFPPWGILKSWQHLAFLILLSETKTLLYILNLDSLHITYTFSFHSTMRPPVCGSTLNFSNTKKQKPKKSRRHP